jgi:hypothetical protein
MHTLCMLCHPFLSLCPPPPRALSGVLARRSVDSVAKLRTKIPALRSLAQDRAFFRGFFSWLFEFSKAKVRTVLCFCVVPVYPTGCVARVPLHCL